MSTRTLTTYYCQFCDIITEFVSNIFRKVNHRKEVNNGIKQLNRMTDYELRDIGICRGDIPRVAAGDHKRRESF